MDYKEHFNKKRINQLKGDIKALGEIINKNGKETK